MSSPQLNDGCPKSTSNGKKYLKNDCKHNSLNGSVRESIKSELTSNRKGEWQRRTIILEKKSGTYGFTLQSYGIHYKKEQEIEIITYVDHVDVEGPAAVAGMREGDVILAINGANMERADHATIVNAITACNSRMRMVVIFEDCVRKVELHLKYINLQRALQSKMRELEQLIVNERVIFDLNWKTHSLPSQKKKLTTSDIISENRKTNAGDQINRTCSRPTLSSENITAPKTSIFMYQYLDLRNGPCVIQPNIRQGSFVITVDSTRNRRGCYHYTVKNFTDCHRALESRSCGNSGKQTKAHRTTYSHGCALCIPNHNNQDVNSLDAYDLATPCCHPHFVPNTRKKVRRKEECSKESKGKEKCQLMDKSTQNEHNYSHSRSQKVYFSGNSSSRYRFLTTESTRTSQCSLQSYPTSNVMVQCDNSATSYSTSLSSDTLFWEYDRCESKSSPRIQCQSPEQHVKPKSWDNLTTKAIGGYGFGYGYLDSSVKQTKRTKCHGLSQSERSPHSQYVYQNQVLGKHSQRESHDLVQYYSENGRNHNHWAPTKFTQSLIAVPKYQLKTSSSETRLACECAKSIEYKRRVGANKNATRHMPSYCLEHFIHPTFTCKHKGSNISSEITRL